MYSKLSFDSAYRKKIIKLLNGGFVINKAGKLEPSQPKGTVQSPWVFINYDARRKYCNWWNGIYCGEFNLIPTFCRFNCWKTVVYPSNVLQTFQLAEVLRALNLPSKCGIDRRNYTYRAWGGYVYGDTLEQGREYYAKVRAAVSATISPEVEVILKRGCTEMERLLPSDHWDNHTEEEKMLEFQLNDLFCFIEHDFRQAAWLVRKIKEDWIYRAIEIRDPTVEQALAQYGTGKTLKDLTVQALTYHEKEKE